MVSYFFYLTDAANLFLYQLFNLFVYWLIIRPLANLFMCRQASWVGSLMPLAALGGGLFGGTAIEKIGRKKTILGTALPFIGKTV